MKKIPSMALTVITIFFLFAGCSINKYNAITYSQANEWISTSFLEENKVGNAYYKNPNYIQNSNDTSDEYYYDETSPKDRTFIIDNQDTFDTIFEKNMLTVDFGKQVLYLYIFADVYPNRNYVIKNILIKENKLRIYYKLENNSKKDATAPYQRCLIVVMEKTDTSSVEFIKQK